MWNLSLDNELNKIIPEERIFRDESMYKHTTFKVGGKVDRYISLASEDEIIKFMSFCKVSDITPYIIGNGSNLLVADSGLDGICAEIGRDMKNMYLDGSSIVASAGTLLSSLAAFAYRNNLTGLEFAAGIPGTVGGAMVMNAGAYGGEMKDVVRSVRVFDPTEGKIMELDCQAMDFSYRHSVVREKQLIVISVVFDLENGNGEVIKAKMDELAAKRREKQPLEYPSAGSTFKRPEGYFAGKLIQDCGLMGYRVGGAQVSEKHAGFVINRENASADDIYNLISDVQKRVEEKFGVLLETEVIMLGKF